MRTELPADLTSARQARSAVRQALAGWGMDHLSGDAELLASELVANAAEHGDGKPISLALRRHAEPGGRPGITCEVTDGSLAMPRRTEPGPDSERGRGLAIVDALARSSGVRASPGRQDHLVHPRPHRPRPPGRRSARARARKAGA